MPEKHLYEYAVIRFVPKVEREEFLNIGIVLFSKQARYLNAIYVLNEQKLRVFSTEVDMECLKNALHVLDEALCNAANMRAIEMDCTGVFEHKRPNGNSCFEVYDICNVEWQNACGENIAAGQATPEDVMKSWLGSSGHKANILSPEYTKIK